MKFLISFLLLLLNLTAFAGPGDGPIVPWPTTVEREIISIEDISGVWVAFDHNALWQIEIKQLESDPGYSLIRIESAALFTRNAVGWLAPADRIFYGKLTMDENHESPFIIFKDHEGTKLRLMINPHRYLDLKLFRTQ